VTEMVATLEKQLELKASFLRKEFLRIRKICSQRW